MLAAPMSIRSDCHAPVSREMLVESRTEYLGHAAEGDQPGLPAHRGRLRRQRPVTAMQGVELAECHHWRAIADPRKRLRPCACRSLPACTTLRVCRLDSRRVCGPCLGHGRAGARLADGCNLHRLRLMLTSRWRCSNARCPHLSICRLHVNLSSSSLPGFVHA